MDSDVVEACLVPTKLNLESTEDGDVVCFNESDAAGCDMEMDEMRRGVIRVAIDGGEFEVDTIDVGLPAQWRRPRRKVASDMSSVVDARCRRRQW